MEIKKVASLLRRAGKNLEKAAADLRAVQPPIESRRRIPRHIAEMVDNITAAEILINEFLRPRIMIAAGFTEEVENIDNKKAVRQIKEYFSDIAE